MFRDHEGELYIPDTTTSGFDDLQFQFNLHCVSTWLELQNRRSQFNTTKHMSLKTDVTILSYALFLFGRGVVSKLLYM